jgi:hypothetical protein
MAYELMSRGGAAQQARRKCTEPPSIVQDEFTELNFREQ